ncbi:hypothetical protein [Natronogracilivirga saccharolytica]|uniref:hypothetical protein n=1 Tax=Natronogracilivirga saccharolytica TaxID=2812953 RepID=UPI003AF44D45
MSGRDRGSSSAATGPSYSGPWKLKDQIPLFGASTNTSNDPFRLLRTVRSPMLMVVRLSVEPRASLRYS